MFYNIKNFIKYISVNNYTKKSNYDLALNVLNQLINDEFMLEKTIIQRGIICYKLFMQDEAYSDFTYAITHFHNCYEAYYYRMKLNFEMNNYLQAISDAEKLIINEPDNIEYVKYKFNSIVFSNSLNQASAYILHKFNKNKYKAIQYILNQMANYIAENEYAKGLKLLDVIELIDPNNPLKVYNEAQIYGLTGDKNKEEKLLKDLDSIFPKYFISHFKFTDMFETRDLLETCFLLELQLFDKQNYFDYPMTILKGYRANLEGRITDSKEAFEQAIKINPEKPEGYVLLAQTLQLLSGYDNHSYINEAEKNYKIAMKIYQSENLNLKIEDMKRQIKHLNSNLSIH